MKWERYNRETGVLEAILDELPFSLMRPKGKYQAKFVITNHYLYVNLEVPDSWY